MQWDIVRRGFPPLCASRRSALRWRAMSDLAPIGLPLSAGSRSAVVVGLFDACEFEPARAEIAGLADYFDYEDWLDAREGLQIGLAMIGIDATLIKVEFDHFLEWSRLTETAPSEGALDQFAALAQAARSGAISATFAVIAEFDFQSHPGALAALAGGRDYRRWSRYRRSRRTKLEALGRRVEQMPVRVDRILDWCACIGQPASETALDHYAQLTLERLTEYSRP